MDISPLSRLDRDSPISLNATDAEIADILLRYRLYTFQPDEMITMMALAGMNPRKLQLDPRLYQYGGLFIYPVGALIAAGGVVGLIDLRNDLAYYLDNPGQFGRFYVAARLYSAAWGFLGVVLAYAVAQAVACGWGRRRTAISDGEFSHLTTVQASGAAGLAAVLFALLPVVVCMSHEAKPHLPGAVLMLMAVWLACRATRKPAAGSVQEDRRHAGALRDFWLMCVACGSAVGMVLSAAPILVLIPVVAMMLANESLTRRLLKTTGRACLGLAAAMTTYLITNPYIVINALVNRAVLRSNFGNSLAMYEIARVGEGFTRVLELTVDGATLPVLVLGVCGIFLALTHRNRAAVVLAVPATVFFLQFVLIGAGKPGEYGRFGVFTNAALAIGAACLVAAPGNVRRSLTMVATITLVVWTACGALAYTHGFWLDANGRGSRTTAASRVAEFVAQHSAVARSEKLFAAASRTDIQPIVAVVAEPAPYSCPPLDFRRTRLVLIPSPDQFPLSENVPQLLLHADDHWPRSFDKSNRFLDWLWPRETPISWANKPFILRSHP